jgi:histidinol-phosphate aminotransferase
VGGKPIEELAREFGLKEESIVKLASNENPLGPSARVLKTIAEHAQHITRYPDGNGFALKKALAVKLGVQTNQITLGNGSSDMLDFLARAYLTPQKNAVFSQHAFAVYPIVTQMQGAKAKIVPAKNWGHDLAAMAKAVDENTGIVFVANPNNPTGTWLGKNELISFLKAVPQRVIVVLDEAYFEFVSEADYPDGLTLLNEFPNVVVTRTFSKIYGLAGLRVGYGVSHTDIADVMNRVRPPFNVNSLALAAAEAALSDNDYVVNSRTINQQGLQQLIAGFKTLNLSYIESVGNFICVKVGDSASVYQALLKAGVIVRPVANYEMPEYLRVSVGTQKENELFLTALKNAISG